MSPNSLRFGAVALLAAIAPAVQAADPPSAEIAQLTDLSLEQLLDVRVTGASKYEQRASDAPASVSILTAEDFRNYGWRTLADALRSLRGAGPRNIAAARMQLRAERGAQNWEEVLRLATLLAKRGAPGKAKRGSKPRSGG